MSASFSISNLRVRLKNWLVLHREIENWQFSSEDAQAFDLHLENLANQEWGLVKGLQSLQKMTPIDPLSMKGLTQNEVFALELLLRKSQNISFTPEQDPEFPFAMQWFIPWAFWNDKNKGPIHRPAEDLEEGMGGYIEERIEEYVTSLQESLSNDAIACHFGYWENKSLEDLPIHIAQLERLEESSWSLYKGDSWLGYGVIPVLIRGKTYHSVCIQDFEIEKDETERFFLGELQEKRKAIFEAKLQAWIMWSKSKVQEMSKITIPDFCRKTKLKVQRTGHYIDTIEAQVLDSSVLAWTSSDFFRLDLDRSISLSDLIQPWIENEDPRHQMEWINLITHESKEKEEQKKSKSDPKLNFEFEGQDLKGNRILH